MVLLMEVKDRYIGWQKLSFQWFEHKNEEVKAEAFILSWKGECRSAHARTQVQA